MAPYDHDVAVPGVILTSQSINLACLLGMDDPNTADFLGCALYFEYNALAY